MKLDNPFPHEVRLLFLYEHACFDCGANGNGRGGLELHHNTGRDSHSAFNAVLLCGYCHHHVLQTRSEQRRLFEKTLAFLIAQRYAPTEYDYDFLRAHPWLVGC